MVYLLTHLGRPIIDAIAQASTKEFLLRSTALLGLGLLCAIGYIAHLRAQLRKPLSKQFQFEPHGGYYLDRKSGLAICTRCLQGGHLIHLMEVEPDHQGPKHCNACGLTYRGPRE